MCVLVLTYSYSPRKGDVCKSKASIPRCQCNKMYLSHYTQGDLCADTDIYFDVHLHSHFCAHLGPNEVATSVLFIRRWMRIIIQAIS